MSQSNRVAIQMQNSIRVDRRRHFKSDRHRGHFVRRALSPYRARYHRQLLLCKLNVFLLSADRRPKHM